MMEFYEQINKANDIIKNIKMPNDYTAKPKAKSFYLPCNIMANILSYLPSHLDHHKKKMKIVNEDFDLIKSTEFGRYRGMGYGVSYSLSWNLHPSNFPLRGGKLKFWTGLIKDRRPVIKLKEDLKVISPKLDRLINELKTKKNIINFLESKNILCFDFKHEKKAEMIESIKTHLKYHFKMSYLSSYAKTVQDFMYSL